MRMEKRKKREEDARSMNQLGGMSNKILISLVNYLPVISLRIVPSFSFSFPILVLFIFQFSFGYVEKNILLQTIQIFVNLEIYKRWKMMKIII